MRAPDSLITLLALLAIAASAITAAEPAWAQPLPGAGGPAAVALPGPPGNTPPAPATSVAPPALVPPLPEGHTLPAPAGPAERPSEGRPGDPQDWARSAGTSIAGAPAKGGPAPSRAYLDGLENLNDDLTMITLRKRRDKAAADGGNADTRGTTQPTGPSAPSQAEPKPAAVEIPALRVVGIDRFRGRVHVLLRTSGGVRSYAPGDPIDDRWSVRSIGADGTVKISDRIAGPDSKLVQVPGGRGPFGGPVAGAPAGGPVTISPSPPPPQQPSAARPPRSRTAG
ncbi:MAG: hypothetical protein KAY22_04445 [Rhizorhabdus sp.]|uniref:hypothetical protein n=1 Tax=Rhizorhabdus sp. TaxID=1968843 RepID=UPI001B3DAE34|nr:hypothetical protein [Rhizorhabdus sp.]MBP8231534.1 hypothetical protein [Rhizorhabdus sp.]